MKHSPLHDAGPLTKPPVAVVVGASGGIGSAIARRLVERGYLTVAVGRNEERLAALRAECSHSAEGLLLPCRMDIGDRADIQRALALFPDEFERAEVLVHSAGDGPIGGLFDLNDEQWSDAIAVKLLGTVRLTQHFARGMVERRRGRVIVINGVFALQPQPLFLANTTINTALRGFAKALSIELGKFGVTVNTVNPGATEGDLWTYTVPEVAKRQNTSVDTVAANVLKTIPLGRLASGDDVAGAVAYLVSADADYVNGAVINVDGGSCMAS
jgi:NAD(P)-dependent dehydrogenase (short-subunit alcohol dehydrogenase family)